MTRKKNKWIIGITAFALSGLIILQIAWIFESAKLKEEQFDHRVSMALNMVVDELKEDSVLIQTPIINTDAEYTSIMAHVDSIALDSIILKAFHYQRIYLPYHIDFITSCSKSCSKWTTYRCSLCSRLSSNYEMRIRFEGKTLEIWQGMAPLMALSLVLIGLLVWGYMQLVKVLWKQHELHETSTDFVNNMAHELKTPISTISLAVKMLRKSETNPNSKEFLDRLQQENEKLKSHTERILNLSQLGRNSSKEGFQKVNLSDILEGLLKQFELKFQESNIEIRSELNQNTFVLGDTSSLEIAFSNLIDNAIKYRSSENPSLNLSVANEGQSVKLLLQDNGIGIPKNYQNQVFDKYFRVPNGDQHDQKGFGLGLTIVSGILDAHDASIIMESKPNQGTTFTITFKAI